MRLDYSGYGRLVFQQDNLEIHEQLTVPNSAPTYYWRSRYQAGKFRGPFKSITEATLHYDLFTAAVNSVCGNVIFVDFSARRKLA